MSYSSAVAQLYELGHELARTPSHKFDLAHMRFLLEPLGSPQHAFRSVLIAGTNGKGSTAATLASILRAAGHRTGLYTSPHLLRINERIRIDGQSISDSDFTRVHHEVEQAAARLIEAGKLPWHPSFFEVLTAMAFLHFARSQVELAVLEVGMGGRLDATNVVEPLVSVITDISLDHQKFLGNTVREIAFEKAGIIRPGGTVVTLPQHPEANDVIGNTILERNARPVSAVPYVPPLSPGSPLDGCASSGNWKLETGNSHPCHPERSEGSGVGSAPTQRPTTDDRRPTTDDRCHPERREGSAFSGHWPLATDHCSPETRNSYPLTVMDEQITVDSPLIGRHQLRNLALAIATAVELNQAGVRITAADIARGIRETRWPGRFQVVRRDSLDFVLDVAHNPAGAWALRSSLSQRCADCPLLFVFGAMRDKAIGEIAEILFPLADCVIATRADNPRSATPEEIRQAALRTGADIHTAPDVAQAIIMVRRLAPANAVVVVTGSIYVVGEAVAALGIEIDR